MIPLHTQYVFNELNLKKKINGLALYEIGSLHASTVPLVILCKLDKKYGMRCRGRMLIMYTAISRQGVGKSTRNNPERYCGWF